jgi:hypothetical protein
MEVPMIASAVDMARRERFERALGWTHLSVDELGATIGVTGELLRSMLRGETEVSQRVVAPLAHILGITPNWILNPSRVPEPDVHPTAVEQALLIECCGRDFYALQAHTIEEQMRITAQTLRYNPRLPATERHQLYSALGRTYPVGNSIRSALGQMSLHVKTAFERESTLRDALITELQAKNL